MTVLSAGPGDVIAVSAGIAIVRDVIEFGEWLRGVKGLHGSWCPVDHIIIVTHQDELNRWMGIQGQPGGVGPVDCTPYLAARTTASNHGQPKPAPGSVEMQSFLASCAQSLGIRYDWVGIAEDALDALHVHDLTDIIDPLWRWPAGSKFTLPGHLVCSSLAAALYELHGWPHPDLDAERQCEPADWWAWNRLHQWPAAA